MLVSAFENGWTGLANFYSKMFMFQKKVINWKSSPKNGKFGKN